MKMNLNSMPLFLLSFAVFIQVAGSPEVFAQDKGNGGGAHFCPNPTDDTKWIIQTYDLYEGTKLPPSLTYSTESTTETKQQILERVLKKIALTQPGTAENIKKVLPMLEDPQYLADASDIQLTEVADIDRKFIGVGCHYHQMVNWTDPDGNFILKKDQILRDKNVYDIMKPFQQAALDLHEAVYKVYRLAEPTEYGIHGSGRVRRFVAEAFSDSPIVTRLSEFDYRVGVTQGDFRNDDYYSWAAKYALTTDKDCIPGNLTLDLAYRNGNKKKIPIAVNFGSRVRVKLGTTRNLPLNSLMSAYSNLHFYSNNRLTYRDDLRRYGLLRVDLNPGWLKTKSFEGDVRLRFNGCGLKDEEVVINEMKLPHSMIFLIVPNLL